MGSHPTEIRLPSAELCDELTQDTWSVCGRFGKPHGVRGEVRLWLYNDQTELLNQDTPIFVGMHPRDERARPELPLYQLTLRSLRVDSRGVFVSFEELSKRDQVDALKHLAWVVPRRDFPDLEDDEFYLMDLVGAEGLLYADEGPNVEGGEYPTEQGRSLGTLVDIFEAGAGELLVFKGSEWGEVLIPNVDPFVIDIDLEARLIKVREIAGLLPERS